MARKSKSLSIRIDEDLHKGINDKVANMSAYVTHLVLIDMAKNFRSELQQMAMKELQIKKITKTMQILNTTQKINSICRDINKPQEKIFLANQIIRLLDIEFDSTYDEELKGLIDSKRKELKQNGKRRTEY